MPDKELSRRQRRAVRNMPPVITCDNCGLTYYQTTAPHVCAEWGREATMKQNEGGSSKRYLLSEIEHLIKEQGKYAQLLRAAKSLLAMNATNYDRAVMRSEGGFDALQKAVDAIDQKEGEG